MHLQYALTAHEAQPHLQYEDVDNTVFVFTTVIAELSAILCLCVLNVLNLRFELWSIQHLRIKIYCWADETVIRNTHGLCSNACKKVLVHNSNFFHRDLLWAGFIHRGFIMGRLYSAWIYSGPGPTTTRIAVNMIILSVRMTVPGARKLQPFTCMSLSVA